MKTILKNNPVGLLLGLLILLLMANPAWAAYDKYSVGESVTVGEFVFDDDFKATTSDCFISIVDPAGNPAVSDALMTASTTGWHYYDFSGTSQEGTYPAVMTCGSEAGGDLAKLDKTFVVGYNNVSTTAVAAAVWNNSDRSLSTSTDIANSVWSATGLTLSDFGSLVSNIWGAATSTMTVAGTIGKHLSDLSISSFASAVWNDTYASTRRLTDNILSLGGLLGTQSYIDSATSTLATTISNSKIEIIDVVDNASSTLAGNINDKAITVAGIWNYADRSATSTNVTDIVSAVWNAATLSLNTPGTIGKQLADLSITDIASAVWSDVFVPTRTLTAFGSLASDVWNVAYAPTRSLTDYSTSTIAAAVWGNGTTRTLSSKTLADGSSLATESYIDNATSTILTKINDNKVLLQALNNISAADVWSYANRTTTGGIISVGEVDLSSSSTDAIWAKATVSLTQAGSIGKLLVDNLDAQVSSRGTSSLTALDVWNSATRSLTDYSTSTIAAAVWNNGTKTLTNYGNDITAADVWNVMSASLTTAGSIGEQLKTNADTSTSGIVAGVWESANRSLTDYSTSTIADAVWNNQTR